MTKQKCYFCDEHRVLEQHHIVPRRFGGSNKKSNLVTLCPNCHTKIEQVYDKKTLATIADRNPHEIQEDRINSIISEMKVRINQVKNLTPKDKVQKHLQKAFEEVRKSERHHVRDSELFDEMEAEFK